LEKDVVRASKMEERDPVSKTKPKNTKGTKIVVMAPPKETNGFARVD